VLHSPAGKCLPAEWGYSLTISDFKGDREIRNGWGDEKKKSKYNSISLSLSYLQISF
jgi:hypothetical protein